MKKYITLALVVALSMVNSQAQEKTIFGTMELNTAKEYQQRFPNSIRILETSNNVSAVVLSPELTEVMREEVTTHGSNYIAMPSREHAIQSMHQIQQRPSVVDFNINQTALVNECLDLVDVANIEEHILKLQNYGTRYHTKPTATQAVEDQKAKWDEWIAATGRTDIHTRLYTHQATPMPSVILTIDGADSPDEFIIVGGHIDSTAYDRDDAPGADDNASGISSLTELVRVLLAKEFVPSRTVEVMAFAAEEQGLWGSSEIAADYKNQGTNVLAYVQFDMTGYNGSSEDVYLMTDWYCDSSLNAYLAELMDHYNQTGPHSFTYSYSVCGYGCSDHASWSANGYPATMPFEAAMGEDNPFIHTPSDRFDKIAPGDHSAKFTKLALEFVIEAAKPANLSAGSFKSTDISMYQRDHLLFFNVDNNIILKEVNAYSVTGQRVLSHIPVVGDNVLNLNQLSDGFYIVEFKTTDGNRVTKKIILN